jgi:hypothetical protein
MRQKLLVSGTAVLFVFFSGLKASYSYTTLYSGSPITSGSWDTIGYYGEIAGTFSFSPSGYNVTDVEWGDLMFTFTPTTITVQQWQCLSGCGGYEVDGWVQLSYVSTYIHDGSALRIVANTHFNGDLTVGVYIDNGLYVWSWQGSAQRNWPASPTGHVVEIGYLWAGMGFSWLGYGPQDITAPTPVPAASISSYSTNTQVSLQWAATSDDPNGTGVYEYAIYRNGALVGIVGANQTLSFTDGSVVPSTTYSYTLSAIDYHFNAGSTTISVTTPHIPTNPPYPSVIPDGRRVGVRPTGTYWGASGENIDMMSGNLNFTLPLLKAQGRSGWSVPFNLTYNSQDWFKDPNGVNWKYGQDVG